ncbi:hypothetical protein SSX86_005021 [Deinandra increscens subsp. villosa]|uniref:BHLH domain-containing protein n=1 Tax=Deinandra increscens subsp. villosa TaxID=3103831 RepID=A0AAP0DPP7_9ASTR
MAAVENLRRKLAMAVKSIQWSYAIFWSISVTEPGVLTWCDGYYNGDIKTRKTIQAEEMEDDDDDNDDGEEEVGLQRTEQLRQLYESLSAASEAPHYEPGPRSAPAALSPEDLTDAEWFFLVCMTFKFTKGQEMPGRTLEKNTTSWLSNAHLADSKVFARSLLAKSASIQTVVCFPYIEGIVEFGITQKVLEEQNIIKQIKALIFDAPPQKVLEIPLESCSSILDDHDLVHNNLDNILEYDQYQEQSWQFVDENDDDYDDDDGEISFHHNNSMGLSDCISQNLASGHDDVWSDDHDHYQCVLLNIFKNTQRSILGPQFRDRDLKQSAFVSWKNYDGMDRFWGLSLVPKMHENRLVWSHDDVGNLDQLRILKADDVKDINHRFSVLSSLVPSRGKFDKVSLLDDTIDYLKALERKVESLQPNKKSHDVLERTDKTRNKRKASCDLKDLQQECFSDCITVSAVEKDVTIEIRCKWRDNMMARVFDALSSLNLESHSVQSSTVDGILTLTIESKIKSCTSSTAKMIRQALQRVISSRY